MKRSHRSRRLRRVTRKGFASLLALVVTLIGSFVTLHGQSGSAIELISATPAGIPAGGQLFIDEIPYDYGSQHVSSDNRYVVFASPSSQIVPGDANGFQDIFVRDRLTGTTTLVSRSSSGAQANNHSGEPTISGNGRYVAFTSLASNLVPTDTNGTIDVFVRDLQTSTTTLVSVSSGGAAANYGAYSPSISADGRYIAFESASDTLVPGDTNVFNRDIFVRDTLLGTTERVSLRPDGTEIIRADSAQPSISADGRRIAFSVFDSNLAGPPPANAGPNIHHGIYVRDLNTSQTILVSAQPDGTPSVYHYSLDPMISANGRYVSFTSFDDLDPNFPDSALENDGPYFDVFVRDLQTSITSRVSLPFPGGPAEESGGRATISGDGRYVAYVSNDTSGLRVRDRLTNTTTIATAPGGVPLDGYVDSPSVSEDGQLVYFESYATNLAPNDTNAAIDTFVMRMAPSADLSLSLTATPLQTPINGNVTFTIAAANAGPNDTTGVAVRAPLPAGLTYVSDTGGGTYSSATGIWSVGSLTSGSSSTLQVVARLTASSAVSFTAQVSASSLPDPDSTPDNNNASEDDQRTVSVAPSLADLSLDLSANTTTPALNSNVTLTTSLTNSGPGSATGVAVRLALPAGLTFVSANPAAAYTAATGTWTLRTVANGATVTLQVIARVTSAGAIDVVAQVSAANESDPDSTPNNSNAGEDDQDAVQLTPAALGIVVNDAGTAITGTDGKCTLIEAIIAANTDAPSGNAIGECAGGSGADVIHLRALNPPYTFSAAFVNASGSNALPVIASDITIDGGGATIQRNPAPGTPGFRLFYVDVGARLALDAVVIRNGAATSAVTNGTLGGGILNAGRLELNATTVSNNVASCDGGGIEAMGPLVVRGNSVIENNLAFCSGGGIGGFFAGSVTVQDSIIRGNQAPSASGGGFYIHGTTTATISNSRVENNTARLEGGGVFAHSNDANLTIANTQILNNVVTAGSGAGIANGRLDAFGTPLVAGGTMTLTNVGVANNVATGGYGGGISNVAARLTATTTTIADNRLAPTGSCGAGLYNAGEATVIGSTVARNTAPGGSGGGVCSIGYGTLAVTNTAIANNVAVGQGGGVALYFSPSATFINSSITSNSGSQGGGLYSATSLVANRLILDNTLVQQNGSGTGGGGLWVLGGATILQNNTRVLSNVASTSGGGVFVDNAGASFATFTMTGGLIDGNTANGGLGVNGGGGGIAHFDTNLASTMTLAGVTITNNHVPLGGNGGGIFNRGRLVMTGGTLRANEAQSGGGLSNGTSLVTGGPATLTNVTIEDNVVTSLGGGIFAANPPGVPQPGATTIVGGVVRNNRATDGGGVFLRPNATVSIGSGAAVTGNSATTSGGGVYNSGSLAVSRVTISGNTADFSAAILSEGRLDVFQSTISGNTAQRVGGIRILAGTTTTITNSTLSGNRAASTLVNSGGALDVSGTANVTASTIADNTGSSGGINSDGRVQLINSILAGNRRSDGATAECLGFGAAVWVHDYNIIGQDAACFLSNAVTANPFSTSGSVNSTQVFTALVGPLADNGGPTQTHALVAGSLAIDAGAFACETFDQRGEPRAADGDGVGGARCDIGAFEQQTPLPAPQAVLTSLAPASATAGAAGVTLTVTGSSFVASSTLYWNGAPRTTYVASPTRLTATIPATDLAAGADITTARITVVNPGVAPSNELPFTIVSTRVLAVKTQLAMPGGTTTASVLATVAAQSSVNVTLTNNDLLSGPVTVTVATYSGAPVGTVFAAGGFFDVQVTGADPSDSAAARFYYPSTVTGATEAGLQLQYWTGTAWAPVIGSGGAAPLKDTTNNLDGTLSGGRFAVTLDATSTPRLMDLSGTVFALMAVSDSTPPVTTSGQSPIANARGWNNTAVTITLTAQDDGSGVAATEYSWDNVTWKAYVGPIRISDEGIFRLRYRSRDRAGNIEATKTLTVKIDRTPPIFLVQAIPPMLWPANSKLVDVLVLQASLDLLSGSSGFTLVSVVSNEPDTTPDDIQGWTIGTPDTQGRLRAERSNKGHGRVYTLTYEAVDEAGNKKTAATAVLVPR